MTRLLQLLRLVFLLVLTAAPAHAQSPTTAFIHVNVVPMDRDRVLLDQTVIVADGRIIRIGPGLASPSGARVIDGRGSSWLLPGLSDMHVHVDSREDLAVLLANGVTTALDMGEAPNSLIGRTRDAVARGALPGPRVLAALAVDGSPRYGHLVVASPQAAEWAVRLAAANGYEFIKVYNGLAPEVFAALAAEARAAGLPLIGHSVESVGLERQVLGGQVMIAHLEEFLYAFFRLPEGADPNAAPDRREIPRAIEFLRRTGAFVTADLATYQGIAEQWGRPEALARYLAMPEQRYLSPSDRIGWRSSGYVRRTGSLAERAAFLARFVDALAESGVSLLAGTDAPTIPGLVLGDALHRNLAALEAAGISRFQALATATRDPGAFLERARSGDPPVGLVREGARADLLLVEANPLDDLGTLRRPLGVMAEGRWHEADALRAMLEEVERTYAERP